MDQRSCHWTDFDEIQYFSFIEKSVEKIQVSLTSDKKNSKKGQDAKRSSRDSNVFGTSSSSDSAHGGRFKETTIVPGTPASEVSRKLPFKSPRTEGGEQRCAFCAQNGETEAMVRSHQLYNSETKRLQCPILRAHCCEICNATGDFAHTRSYCPFVCKQGGKVQSTAIALKSTKRQANGVWRKVKVGYRPETH